MIVGMKKQVKYLKFQKKYGKQEQLINKNAVHFDQFLTSQFRSIEKLIWPLFEITIFFQLQASPYSLISRLTAEIVQLFAGDPTQSETTLKTRIAYVSVVLS